MITCSATLRKDEQVVGMSPADFLANIVPEICRDVVLALDSLSWAGEVEDESSKAL